MYTWSPVREQTFFFSLWSENCLTLRFVIFHQQYPNIINNTTQKTDQRYILFEITSRDSLSHLFPVCHIFQLRSTCDSNNGPLDSCSCLLTGSEPLWARSCILYCGGQPTNRMSVGIRWESVFTPGLQWEAYSMSVRWTQVRENCLNQRC